MRAEAYRKRLRAIEFLAALLHGKTIRLELHLRHVAARREPFAVAQIFLRAPQVFLRDKFLAFHRLLLLPESSGLVFLQSELRGLHLRLRFDHRGTARVAGDLLLDEVAAQR